MEYLYMGVFWGFTPVWVCLWRVNTHMGVFLEDLHPYESLEMGSCESLEDCGLKSLTYGCHLLL